MKHCLTILILTVGVCVIGAGCELDKAQVHEDAASSRSDSIGRPAPAFALPDQTGQTVSLGSQAGTWVVLYFYPMDDTAGCTCQATEFTELIDKYSDMDAVIFGVSPDSVESHQAFIAKHKLKVNLLSDESHDTMSRYGAWVSTSLGEQEYGRVVRSTYIIDPEGVIRHHWPEVIPEGHAMRVRNRLAQLQAP